MSAEIELALEDAEYREYLVGAANRATEEHMKLYYKTLFAEVRRRESALAHTASARRPSLAKGQDDAVVAENEELHVAEPRARYEVNAPADLQER